MSGYRSSGVVTLIDLNQAKAYQKFKNIQFYLKPIKNGYSFGKDKQRTFGSIEVKIPIGSQAMAIRNADVLQADVPFLNGLDIMDRYRIYVNKVKTGLFRKTKS